MKEIRDDRLGSPILSPTPSPSPHGGFLGLDALRVVG